MLEAAKEMKGMEGGKEKGVVKALEEWLSTCNSSSARSACTLFLKLTKAIG